MQHVHAQADLTFSGGNGAPLELKLNAPVTYVVTTAPTNVSPIFVFQNVGNVFTSGYYLSGTITFTIDGGQAYTLSDLTSGFGSNDVEDTDARIDGAAPGVVVGDTVVLSAGTLTTGENFVGTPPAGGSFQTFLVDDNFHRLNAADGISVPEPSSWVMIGTSFALLVGILNYRLRQA